MITAVINSCVYVATAEVVDALFKEYDVKAIGSIILICGFFASPSFGKGRLNAKTFDALDKYLQILITSKNWLPSKPVALDDEILRYLLAEKPLFKGMSLAQVKVVAQVGRMSDINIYYTFDEVSDDQRSLLSRTHSYLGRPFPQQDIDRLYEMREHLRYISEDDWQAIGYDVSDQERRRELSLKLADELDLVDPEGVKTYESLQATLVQVRDIVRAQLEDMEEEALKERGEALEEKLEELLPLVAAKVRMKGIYDALD